ncbi:maleylpyruvate isomerase N-terminal domain-containing protein [Solwaraspora sp. WMMD406]|uniref:maleylpyruvate isomerase N-terminal domain-containing protein n=1 Tax=Solwaraspora sp. WMMD406 TaxID=3016095 RepID=UPI002417B754|nr:maleylpyruvate isomerase N-terminal domain-containing protein [Solwaraspora sp. WMMD406]MDG4766339.1 maleylpyruvate isomerase N-terminal domain-containing protein [Solwaraspora sp. WMMD406]
MVERVWRRAEVDAAYRAEAGALVALLRSVPDVEFDRPTRCAPWTVRELLAHTVTALGRTTELLDAPRTAEHRSGRSAPAAETGDDTELVSAAGYYVADARFAPAQDTARIDHARRLADAEPPQRLVDDLARRASVIAELVAAQPADRRVVTRHGDLMTLTDFQATRVVEAAVHGLDVTDALGLPPCLTGPGADVVVALALGHTGAPLRAARGWDRAHLVRAVTGRVRLTTADQAELARHGGRKPFFGR